MGRRTPTDPDTRLWGVEHSFTGAGQKSAAITVRSVTWFAIGGTFTGGTVSIEVSFDGGTNWLAYFGQPNEPLLLFTPGAMLIPCGTESAVLMRMSCDSLSTGTIAARLSGGGNPS
jgi:hypothetical protein